MAGILDSKSRVLDTVITQEGKRQIATGGLRAVYATVSDKSTYYEESAVSGSTNATLRLYFESPTENINDSIMMESDDSGKLLGYPVQGSEFYNTDGVVSGRTSASGSLVYANATNFSGFASLAEGVITSSIDRFKNLYSLGTRDPEESDSLQMVLSQEDYTFTVNNLFPFLEGPTDATSNLDYIEPLFFDERLANVPNFQYLPPLVEPLTPSELKKSSFPKKKRFGNYVKIQRPQNLNFKKVMRQMNIFSSMSGSTSMIGDPDADTDETSPLQGLPYSNPNASGDYGLLASQQDGSTVNLTSDQLPKERVSIFFRKTSSTNNLMMQMFELDTNASKLKKLDVIDFGVESDTNDSLHPYKHMFFIGKIFINSINLPVFVNLFIIIMD